LTPELGIIEGYFGRAWTWAERAAVVDCLAPAGYRFFHYAPKLDAKLRRQWRLPYSEPESVTIASFAGHCRSHSVRFGVGLTPYGAHVGFDSDAKADMRVKLAQLDSCGIDDLAILFDDMRGDIPDLADRQGEIAAFIMDNSRASRFFLCPSYYSSDPKLDRAFGQRPERYLETLGRKLDSKVAVFWSGEEVCAPEIGLAHLRDVAAVLGRKVALWDNYPVNDGPRMSQYLHLRAFTGRSPAIAAEITHHAINPASQPILGCIPALTLPMLYAQGSEYRYSSAFLAAATRICGFDLALMLQEDLLMLQSGGLDRLTDATKRELRNRYSSFNQPAARELIDWLNNGYAITGEMLRTQ
jgi:hyaluronoglucosaminidase